VDLDPSQFSNLSTLAGLFAEFLKFRGEKAESIDAAEFRKWLEKEAFPKLADQSEQTFRSLMEMKAQSYEAYVQILTLLREIRAHLSEETATDRWAAMDSLERAVLAHLLDRAQRSDDEAVELKELSAVVNSVPKDAADAAEALDERGLAKVGQATGGHFSVTPTAAGLVLAWSAVDPTAFVNADRRFKEVLRGNDYAVRIGVLAQSSDVPFALAFALAQEWQTRGLITFDADYAPVEAGLVHGVRPLFRKRIEQELDSMR